MADYESMYHETKCRLDECEKENKCLNQELRETKDIVKSKISELYCLREEVNFFRGKSEAYEFALRCISEINERR